MHNDIDLHELIQNIDIVDYISQYVELESKNGEYWGLSPFKDENTPSFSVRRENGLWYDFSSGKSGNLYSFIKEYFKCPNREVIDKIIEFANGKVSGNCSCNSMYATRICKKYSKQNNQKQKQSKSEAVVLSDDYMDRYELNEDKLAIWEEEGISKESIKRFNVKYDSFANRIVYPIRNIYGEIVNVGGRTLDENYKEKRLRKYTYYFPWGDSMDLIYGLYENLEYIREAKEIIIFEGCKSVLISDTWGIKNTGALLTSHCNLSQVKILAKLGVKVVFALDEDVDVRKDKNINKLKKYVQCEYISNINNLLNAKDSPVDRGLEVFKELYNNRKPFR